MRRVPEYACLESCHRNTDAGGFPVGASISTPDSLVTSYGFEGISTPASRNSVMGRILDHLLD
jgi:hypothetical protein